MRSIRVVITMAAVAVVCVGVFSHTLTAAASEDEKGLMERIRSMKPEAGKGIDLDVRIEKPTGRANEQAGAKRFLVKVAKPAYLTALFVSSEGKPFVFFPDGETSSTYLEPGKEYVFSAPDSKTADDEKARKGKAVFLVTPRHWDMKALIEENSAGGQKLVGAVRARVALLAARLREMAAEDGFNQAVLDLEGRSPSLKLMGLPSAAQSKKPEEVVGTQGRGEDETKEGGR
jgi:hypothetical protein